MSKSSKVAPPKVTRPNTRQPSSRVAPPRINPRSTAKANGVRNVGKGPRGK